MDNVCHTLVGAAIGESGLKRRTRFGNLTLMIAANLPDIDVLVFATDMPPVAFRRGWTHGIAGQAMLPIALALIMASTVWLRPRQTGEDKTIQTRASLLWLSLLSYLGLYSHLFLDYLNNYGVRLLAPFDWRWFYGDAVFIIDPWLWIVLGTGIWVARRTGRPTAARGALAFAACYVALMLGSSSAARSLVLDSWSRDHGDAPSAVMVGPTPVVPFLREVIIDGGDHYETGRFSWLTAGMRLDPGVVQKHEDRPEISRARDVPHVRAFLSWSRFPYWELQEERTGTRVTVKDMRFGDRFAATTVIPR